MGGVIEKEATSKNDMKQASLNQYSNTSAKTRLFQQASPKDVNNSNINSSNNNSNSSNNNNTNDVEMSGGFADDQTEIDVTRKNEIKQASPKDVNNNNNNNTNDVEMSGGLTDDQTETKMKKVPPKEVGNTTDTTDGYKRTQKRKRTATNTTGVDGSTEDSSENSDSIGHHKDYRKTFRSSAKDALAKAMLLAIRHREMEASKSPNKTQKQTPKLSGLPAEENEPPNEIEIPIEVLRDLINQNPGEFWQSREKSGIEGNSETASETETTTTERNNRTDLVFYERIETNDNRSENEAKRRKHDIGNKDQEQPSPPQRNVQQHFRKEENKKVPCLEDFETLSAVGVLLEASAHQLSTVWGNAAKGLLERMKLPPKQARASFSGGEPKTTQPDANKPNGGVEDMARKVARSLIQDMSEVLQAKANASFSIGPATGMEYTEEEKQTSKPQAKPPGEPAVELSLLCDEEDLLQLRNNPSMDDSDDDDDIIEISPDENYIQQHLLCHEKGDGLFKKTLRIHQNSPTQGKEVSDDVFIAQKVAILRETKRLIRAKTLVLTKRRLAIQGDEDLSLVI